MTSVAPWLNEPGAQIELLKRRVQRALDFAEAAVALISSEDHGLDLKTLEAPQDKVISETAMLLRAVLAIPPQISKGLPQRARQLAAALEPWARHPRVKISLLLFPALALDYAAAHLTLKQAGISDENFDTLLELALQAQTAQARERLPHRELEQQWLLKLHRSTSALDSATLECTALWRTPDLLSGSRDDWYAFTHALLYATDFGHRPLHPAPPVPPADMATSALCGPLDDDDFDLAGELLLTWPFLHVPWSPAAALTFQMMNRLEHDVGVVPSLSLDQLGYQHTPPEQRRHYVTATAYHTAFVMGLLCATLLRAPMPSASTDAAPLISQSLLDTFLAQLHAREKRPQWVQDFMAQPTAQQRACGSFLLDVLVRRAVRQLDLQEVRSLLAQSLHEGLPTTPLRAQAAGLLRRLAHLHL